MQVVLHKKDTQACRKQASAQSVSLWAGCLRPERGKFIAPSHTDNEWPSPALLVFF